MLQHRWAWKGHYHISEEFRIALGLAEQLSTEGGIIKIRLAKVQQKSRGCMSDQTSNLNQFVVVKSEGFLSIDGYNVELF